MHTVQFEEFDRLTYMATYFSYPSRLTFARVLMDGLIFTPYSFTIANAGRIVDSSQGIGPAPEASELGCGAMPLPAQAV